VSIATLPVQRKDEPPREATDVSPPQPGTSDDYRRLLVRHRRIQLSRTAENMQRLAMTYDRAADAILEQLRKLPDSVERTGTGWLAARLNLIRTINEELERYRTDYRELLDLSMISSAQMAADRELEAAELVGAPPDVRLQPTLTREFAEFTVNYSALARDAVETVASRYYRDGLRLKDRLANLSDVTRQSIEDVIVRGIADGTSARDMAKELQKVLSAEAKDTPGYKAMRIARTEVNNAFRESHTKSTLNPDGSSKSYISGIRWNLSLSHARSGPDICDIYAAHDEGLGPGVYVADSVPTDHPNGLCFQTTELKEWPGVMPRTMTMKPDVDAVSETHIRYYAERLQDPVAQAALAARGGV
jgi:hypothetical protein